MKDEVIDIAMIKLMAKIMQEGMTGVKIAELLNDANKKFQFYKGTFQPPGQIQERKESYAQKWLNALKENGWNEALFYIAKQLSDNARIYFEEDESHPYPKTLVKRLKEKLKRTIEGKQERPIIHGKAIKSLLKGIENEELADLLYQDLKDIDLCMSVGAWKSTLILCGSVLEAILSDWLGTLKKEEISKAFKELYPNKKHKEVSDYTLEELIDMAEKVGLIHGYHAAISDGIRNFRNLIHPNLAIRQQIKPSKAIAEIGKQIILVILQERQKIK
ncbi:MAG: hypothetical protein NUV70_07770 [Caldiserica bacterium]|jgi:hypothetical protein|nr:hypothetical protein [Caldisericota bacterium]